MPTIRSAYDQKKEDCFLAHGQREVVVSVDSDSQV